MIDDWFFLMVCMEEFRCLTCNNVTFSIIDVVDVASGRRAFCKPCCLLRDVANVMDAPDATVMGDTANITDVSDAVIIPDISNVTDIAYMAYNRCSRCDICIYSK